MLGFDVSIKQSEHLICFLVVSEARFQAELVARGVGLAETYRVN